MAAPIAQDFTKSSVDILLQLIKKDNPKAAPLTPEVVTFGLPTVATETRNSKITISAVKDSGYSGAVTMEYDRVNIGSVPGERSTTFPIGNAIKLSDLIPEINAAYDINLQEGDYTDVDLAPFTGEVPNETQNVQLVVVSDNPCFIGSLVIIVASEDLDLASIITNTVMNGLTYAPTDHTPPPEPVVV